MKRISSFPLATFDAGLWRLGQAGCALRFKNGPTLVIDPYLTDAAAKLSKYFARTTPPPFSPAELAADLVLITHTHIDHLDPATLAPSPALATARFIGPPSVCERLERLGAPPANLTALEPGGTWEGPTVTVKAVPAFHGADVPDALGFRVSTRRHSPTVYFTGDTVFDDRLAPAAGPTEVLVAPINGKLGNMGPEGAARLAAALKPKFAVPCHYDLMAANGEDPAAFEFHLEREKFAGRACVLERMAPLLLNRDGTGVAVTRQLAMAWDCGLPIPEVGLPPDYRLRPFREADLPAIGEIYRATFGLDESWYKREFVSSPFFHPDRVAVVEYRGKAVATALAWEEGQTVGMKRGLLHFVATHPEHHQRGLGKAVTAAVMRYFTKDGRTQVFLTTDDHRLRAIRAYLAMGFKPVEENTNSNLRWGNVQEALEQGARE